MLIIKLSFWTMSFCFEQAGHWGVWLHFSEIWFILSRLIHPLLLSHVAYSRNFHISCSASASSLLNSLCTHYTINLIQRFWPTQAKTQAENLCIASHLTHNSVIVSPSRFLPVMSPIRQIRLTLNKAIKGMKTARKRRHHSTRNR